MTTKAYIGTADALYAGRAYDGALYLLNGMKGRPVSLLTKVDLGTPAVAVADAMIKAATSTELPNNTTITYSAGDGVASPLDSASLPTTTTISTADGTVTVWPLTHPRNITCAATHSSSLVAMTITITGYDRYRQKQVKTLTISATGTSKTGATTATFAYIKSIAITSAGNATTNTLNVGFGDVLGLPYFLEEKMDLIQVSFDDAGDTGTTTVVAGVTTTPSATSGDVRGTIDIDATLNGAKKLKVIMHISDTYAATARGLLGKVPYAG